MPDSKLVEKLGFTLVSSEKYPGLYDIVKDGYESQGATAEEIALWNLCLELSERLAGFEMEIRQRLWMGHGHAGMYGDDGEMQCCECPKYWDYKREPLENLREQVGILNNQRLNEALASLAADPERKDA